METVNVNMQMPKLPEGYKYTGEYRVPLAGEYFFKSLQFEIARAGEQYRYSKIKQFIVRKLPWVPKEGDFYYYLLFCDGKLQIHRKRYLFTSKDEGHIICNNIFKTKEQAMAASDAVLATLKEVRDTKGGKR